MPTTEYGVTDEGFQIKRLQEIKDDLEDRFKEEFGTEINLAEDSVFGKVIGLMAQPIADLWELAQAVYAALYPSSAEGTSLDRCCELVGITRKAATESQGNVLLFGDENTTIEVGARVASSASAEQFELQAEKLLDNDSCERATFEVSTDPSPGAVAYRIQIGGPGEVAPITNYDYASEVDDTEQIVVDALVDAINADEDRLADASDAGDNVIQLDGVALATGDPDQFYCNNLATLTRTKIGVLGLFKSVNTGEILGLAGELSEIISATAGWDSCTNIIDVTLGTALETDAELRIRRARSLAIAGHTTVDAIYAKLLQLNNVTAVNVIENITEDTSDPPEELPPHSLECIVQGGDEDEIAETIWENKPAGIQTHGDNDVEVTDSQGYTQTVYYSRPTTQYVWVHVKKTQLYDEELYPDNGDATIAQTVLETGQALGMAKDILQQRFLGPIYNAVDGLQYIDIFVYIDTDPDMTPTYPGDYTINPVSIAFNEVSSFSLARIVVDAA